MVQGFGTTFYGQCDYWTDESYLTTEWIVIAAIPLIPMRTLRVNPDVNFSQKVKDSAESTPFHHKTTYVLQDRGKLNLRQVLRTYALAFLLAAWLVTGVWLLLHLHFATLPTYIMALFLASFIVPGSVPILLRRRAKKRLPKMRTRTRR